MSFSKKFPRTIKSNTYPEWVEITLSEEEERLEEEKAQKENIRLFRQCIEDAKLITQTEGLKEEDMISLATTLFEKRASHVVYWKERKCKEKFDDQ